jgi:C-terminal processing protease CtpA/Prc
MRRKMLSLVVVLLAVFIVAPAQESQPINQTYDKARIERLVGLAKVWGAVKYFHPYLAYREIDWDKALVETIPQVNAAKTPQAYGAAINHLLSFLSDKNSYAYIASESKAKEQPKAAAKEFLRLENGVFFIDPVSAANIREQNQDTYSQILQKNMALLAGAKSIVIDGRGRGVERSEIFDYYFDDFLRQTLTQILNTDIPLGVYRYRMHNGYAPQTGSTSGGYYSALVTTAPETLAGQNKNRMLPTVFLIDGRTLVPSTMLSGLQATHNVFIVQDGEGALEASVKTFEIKLPDNVAVKMRTAELVNPDGAIGFQSDEIVSQDAGEDKAMKEALKVAGGEKPSLTRKQTVMASAPQIAPKDMTYAEMEFPSSEYRLLALFRFWNVINYFFPYKHLIDKPWDDVLPKYIPKLEADKDAAAYQLTVREMVAEIQDSHGFVGGQAGAERLGRFLPPFAVKFIENQTVVDYVFDDVKDVKVGDVILAIDGEPIEKFRERYARYLPASTPQALMRNVHPGLLRGQENSKIKLTLRGVNGSSRELEIARTISGLDPRWEKIVKERKLLPVFTVLPSGFGYVDLDRLEFGDVNKMFETIKDTPATIFDMRGYPKGTGWAIAPRLTDKTNVPAALFSNPIWEALNLGNSDYTGGTNFTFTQSLPERTGDIYKGKVVMLINEYAQSQSEHTAMFFEAATNVTFIGTPTAGANGDITYMVLPGNLVVSFSGHDVRHADGRQLQRVGIQPTVRVSPTIRGLLIEKRDEILEAAIKFLKSNKTTQKRRA